MRKIKIFEHTSLDGVIQPRGPGEDGEFENGGWMAPFRSLDGREALMATQGMSFDLLLGRRTYDLWSGYWPRAEKSPMADALNGATKYVATHRPDSLAWGPVKDLGADVLKSVRGLKSTDGRDLIVWGSTTLTSMLLKAGLIDEIVLIIYPVLLGRGKRYFSDGVDPRELALVSTKATSKGAILNVYRPLGPLRAAVKGGDGTR